MFNEFWLIATAPFIGGFLATLVVRLPRREPVVFSRSKCRTCGTKLEFRDTVPLFSWILAKGHCRYCSSAISSIYPMTEILCVIVAVWAAIALDGWLASTGGLLGSLLLTLALIDFREFLLPDALTLPLVAFGLIVAASDSPMELTEHLLGAAAGFIFFWMVAYGYAQVRKREGLGMGDAKLMAGAGAWVSLTGLPTVVLYGTFFALAYVGILRCSGRQLTAETQVPFGGFLCLGIWLTWLYGPLRLH